MARYIDAEMLEDGSFPFVTCEYQLGWNDALSAAFLATPTADVAEMKHGRWEDRENPQWKAYEIRHCSLCGWAIHKTKLRKKDLKWHFCPNCGAKMDLKEGAQE